ncbi:EAL domain-containing protein [Rhodococcoides corynebacterioides]|uniref:EAL domain-containing protein n=1 Tax=Rhodococcoides corynebacterioides TaxID=53972 RepID=UPI00082A0A1A|nr:EAL domain-containing protein [Rhodococcus corynebacterioides]
MTPALPDGVEVRSLYQPVVDLTTRAMVGVEALARGPAGSPFERPEELFAAARAAGRLREIDWLCRVSALRGALSAPLPPGQLLFVNIEPGVTDGFVPPEAVDVLRRAETLSVVVEITERDLLVDPAALLRAVDRIRGRGWMIAVDDVGADAASLALLPFLEPDVIKLDMSFTQARGADDTASVISAVAAESGRTGARVLAEGIETERHLRSALDLGATMGQGYLFGEPAPLPRRVPEPSDVTAPPDTATDTTPMVSAVGITARRRPRDTPFAIGAAAGRVQRADGELVVSLSRRLEQQALANGPSTVVLTTIPYCFPLDTDAIAGARGVAGSGALVTVFGRDAHRAALPSLPNLRTRDIAPDDPIATEFTLIVVGPHLTAGMLARVVDDGPDPDFDYRLTYDRTVVLDAATYLLDRTSPAPDMFGPPANG